MPNTPKVQEIQDHLKANIADAVARQRNRVWIGSYTHEDGTVYETFVVVEERKR